MAPDAPLPYRLRSEIEWTPIQGQHRHWWIAKDPLRSNIFRCGDEVRRILQSLDGRRSLRDLDGLLARSPSTQRVSLPSIHHILQSAIQKQLLVQNVGCNDMQASHEGAAATIQKHSIAAWLRFFQRSPWSLIQGKQRIGNPEGTLKRLVGRTDWLFSRAAVGFWLAFIVVSAFLVLAKASTQSGISFPSLTTIASHTVQWLVLLLLTRIAHELGHAIVCVRMGARCREFGVFFMLGVACPYVDVTDSWRLHHAKARMAVAAAGVYVEWIIAAIAGMIWYSTHSGSVHSIAWQVMMVCSLTTLLINANPLMRYDGYFLLSDYWEVVNLREESENAFANWVRRWCLGECATIDEQRPSWREFGLIVYACLSWFYRCTLVVALVCSVHTLSARWQLPMLGWAFAMLMFVSFLAIPVSQKMFQSWSKARRNPNGPYRLVAMWLGCVILVVNVGWLPLPHRIACHGCVQPENPTSVYTQSAGRIPLVSPTDSDPSFALENPWIEDRARLAIQRQKQIECKIASTRMAAYQEPSIIDRLPALSTMASIAEKQTSNAIKEVESLKIMSPVHARWLPAELPSLESLEGSKLADLTHTVNDQASLGRWLPAGTLIGYVTESDRVSIAATVPISQLGDIAVGMPARVRFDQLPSQIYAAKVVEISKLTATPDKASRNQQQDSRAIPGETTDPDSLVSISLTVDGISQKMLAMNGTAEVVVWSKPKSLYHHISQLAGATFGPNGLQSLSR